MVGCNKIFNVAVEWLDETEPGHSPVANVQLFQWASRDANGNLAPVTFSGPAYAVVLVLEDGSERATLVSCGLSLCMQLDPFTADPLPSP